MRALVTGGAGFIGSHLVDRLLADGYHVDVVDDFSTGSLDNLADAFATGRCHALNGDITSPGLADWVAMRSPDVVFHLAAQIDVRASVADPARDAHVNVLGTVNVLEGARRARVGKVVNVSSVAIYGTCARLPVDASTPTNPLSPYASSKLAAEVYCHQYQQLYGLPATTVVLTNVYGPRQHAGTGAVAIWAEAMVADQPTYLYGDGNIRDYLYVADAVDALVRAADPSVTERHVEVGTGHPVTDRLLHDAVATAVGSSREPVSQERRRGDVAAMVVDPTPARLALGWKPRTSLTAGLAATVDHIRTQIPPRRTSSAHW
jgi:UDP-glucose 4-epimerase